MFAKNFNENEKKYFTELLLIMAESDGDIQDEEKELLEIFRIEMDLKNIPEKSSYDIESVLSELSKSNESIKKAIYFELYTLVKADNIIDDSELKLLNKISSKLSISQDKVNNIRKAADTLAVAYSEIIQQILS